MEIQLSNELYEKTDDENIVYQYKLSRQEIILNKLKKQINDLEVKIILADETKVCPEDATEEMKEVYDRWNDDCHNSEDIERDTTELNYYKQVDIAIKGLK